MFYCDVWYEASIAYRKYILSLLFTVICLLRNIFFYIDLSVGFPDYSLIFKNKTNKKSK